MAANLVKSQFRVVGFDPARPALDALEAAGGLSATSAPRGQAAFACEPVGQLKAARSTKRALLVEDDFLIALDMAQMLTRGGWEVIGPVASGEQAVEAALALRPDAIIMDIRLKGFMSGLEAAEAIRGRLPAHLLHGLR